MEKGYFQIIWMNHPINILVRQKGFQSFPLVYHKIVYKFWNVKIQLLFKLKPSTNHFFLAEEEFNFVPVSKYENAF